MAWAMRSACGSRDFWTSGFCAPADVRGCRISIVGAAIPTQRAPPIPEERAMPMLARPSPEARRAARERGAWTMLPYTRHLDDITVATRDGQLLEFLHLKGLAFETSDTAELNYRKGVR